MSTWYERWGGYLVSLFLHLLLISCLVIAFSSEARIVEPPPLEVSFEFAAQSEAVEDTATPLAEAIPQPEIAAATGDMEDIVKNFFEQLDEMTPPPPAPEPIEQAQPEETEVAEVQPTPEPTPEPAEEPAATPEPVQALTPEQVLAEAEHQRQEKLEAAWQQYKNLQPVNSQRESLREAVTADEVKVRGLEHLDEYTPGAETGAVRTFDWRGSPELVDQVMKRYDIRYVTRYLEEVGPGFINKGQTNRGEFYAPTEPGIYEVLEIGPAGTAKLRELEVQALKKNGFNPNTDRVVLITFGIVRTERGWDLGVVNFKGEKIGF